MRFTIKNNKQILVRRLTNDDIDKLCNYFQHLSLATLQRFGPHLFDKQSLIDMYDDSLIHIGFIAEDTETSKIIAYFVIRIGCPEHDRFRLQSYGLHPENITDCTLAPSVADSWQSFGVGNCLFNFILSDLKMIGIKRIILWGGVQSGNLKAVNYYFRNGFRKLGQFEHHGENFDMILDSI